MERTIAGIIIILVSTSIMNIGMVIQKKAVSQLPPFEDQGVLGAGGVVSTGAAGAIVAAGAGAARGGGMLAPGRKQTAG